MPPAESVLQSNYYTSARVRGSDHVKQKSVDPVSVFSCAPKSQYTHTLAHRYTYTIYIVIISECTSSHIRELLQSAGLSFVLPSTKSAATTSPFANNKHADWTWSRNGADTTYQVPGTPTGKSLKLCSECVHRALCWCRGHCRLYRQQGPLSIYCWPWGKMRPGSG